MTTFKTKKEAMAYQLGVRDATKKWNENEGAWVNLNKKSVIEHKQKIEQTKSDEREKLLDELKDWVFRNEKVCPVLGDEYDMLYNVQVVRVDRLLEQLFKMEKKNEK